MPGYTSKAYLVTYSNGAEVSREFISSDYYAPMNTIVKVGTKKANTTTENSNSASTESINNNTNNSQANGENSQTNTTENQNN